jgi:putative exporter of polyketide antibiotics
VMSARTVAPATVQPQPAGRGLHTHVHNPHHVGNVYICVVAMYTYVMSGANQLCIIQLWPDHDMLTGPDELYDAT